MRKVLPAPKQGILSQKTIKDAVKEVLGEKMKKFHVHIYRTTVKIERDIDALDEQEAMSLALQQTREVPFSDYAPAERERLALVYRKE